MRRTTVLFVDDNALIRSAYGALLRDEGYRVLEAADGCEALKLAGAFQDDCLVVLDECMPCMSGHEVLEHLGLRADAKRFRVIIISGSGSLQIFALTSQRIRVAAIVEKPFTAAELLGTLNRLAA
jgi:CheY-like chemotaxis protein